jgi:hypothetical protein
MFQIKTGLLHKCSNGLDSFQLCENVPVKSQVSRQTHFTLATHYCPRVAMSTISRVIATPAVDPLAAKLLVS